MSGVLDETLTWGKQGPNRLCRDCKQETAARRDGFAAIL
jgi:hypothetical protein